MYVFGRSLFTVSFFGANVYPENVTVGLEQPGISDMVTGKFVIESVEDADRDRRCGSPSRPRRARPRTRP